MLTLVGQPFSQFHIFWASAQGQKVTLDIERSVLLLKEVLRSVRVVDGGGLNSGVVRREGLRIWDVAVRALRGRRLARASVVHLVGVVIVLVISASAKTLAAIKKCEISVGGFNFQVDRSGIRVIRGDKSKGERGKHGARSKRRQRRPKVT
jgi:hypothetical protein